MNFVTSLFSMEDHKYFQDYERLDRWRDQTWKNEDIPENGLHTSYFLDDFNDISQKKCTEEYYKNGKLDGLQKTWYETGELLSESNFKNGLLHGESTNWYKNGQKKSEGTYGHGYRFLSDSVLHGLWTEWYENGQMKREGLYLNGMRHYTWEKWNDKGELIYSEWNHVFV